MSKLKQYVKRKLHSLFSNNIETSLREILAYNVLKDLNLSNKEDILLSFYPKPAGFMKSSSSESNIRKYLSLVRPIDVESIDVASIIKLKRFGGSNDGGYIMATPPHFLIKN
ncbi:hypothetical protein [Helicobacter sp. MIT 14-3879]|uniref:hypothetical protein n=1 Tax=Helicobacter sp. MIT 14-3879 TaxID=2040649 RepID=UPI000E1F6606|nr:hypothetical protein [Helicobacter sp. MIT 14-3879]RDU65136.1 hypothetical protein CQA44_02145 [Helicobacter sp. MIT 14-3879]